MSDAVSEFKNGFLESFDAKEINEGINAFVDTVVGGIADAIGKADKTKLTEDFLTQKALSGIDQVQHSYAFPSKRSLSPV